MQQSTLPTNRSLCISTKKTQVRGGDWIDFKSILNFAQPHQVFVYGARGTYAKNITQEWIGLEINFAFGKGVHNDY